MTASEPEQVGGKHIRTASVKPTASPLGQSESEQVVNPQSVFGNCFTIDILIDGVKTCCLLGTSSEATTMSETHFKKQFEGKMLSPARQVKLTAANRLDIPIIGCLYTDIECLGKELQGKCEFVLHDRKEDRKDGAPGILGMNVLGELRSLFVGFEGVKRMDRHKKQVKCARLSHNLMEMGKE